MKQLKPSEVRPNPSNPRIIKDDKYRKLVQSLKDFPEMANVRPIVVNTDHVILGGNMRFRAMQEAGWKQIPVEVVDWPEDKQREFIIKDNVGFGEWDLDALANEWETEELEAWGLDIPEFAVTEVEAVEDDYAIPEEVQTDIVPGDLFEIGSHRLLCGDSTDSDAVARLMDGKLADMVFTDPPYDLTNYKWTDYLFNATVGHIFILNSEQRNVDISAKHRDLMSRWYAVDFRKAHLISNNVPMTRVDFIAEFRTSDKVRFVNRNKGFRTLIECLKNHSESEGHNQAKNPELPGTFIEHHTQEKNLVLDLFLGSGTTMVAAHQLNRVCYGIELDPKYCQVIVDRMFKLDPTLQIKRNGQPYVNSGKIQAS